MPRSYKHISNYEKEILELKSEGLTLSERVKMELEYDETIELLLILGTQKLFEKMRKEAKRL